MQYRKIIVTTLVVVASLPLGASTLGKNSDSVAEVQQQEYARKAAEARAEANRRSLITSSLYAKYPRPVDVAKARADYFQWKADQLAQDAEAQSAQH